VDIIGHSMGVTLGRKVVQGGAAWDQGNYNLGSSLSKKVDTFVGISGANWGITDCYFSSTSVTCNAENGFYPGYMIGPIGLSTYLDDLNNGAKEGSHVYAMLSEFDDIIGYGDVVYGQYTSSISTQDSQVVYATPTYTHMNMKDLTGAEQLKLVTH